ncbi:MAG: SDR family oxidoreductase [Candidatus Ratteibacteria bacterium]|nr:SDR family oxidoreductase [Candidatus Ratteibacteria bacterium]
MDKTDNLFDISGKVVVITGAGGILCGSIAKALAQRGAKVALLDIKKEAGDSIANEINKNGGEAISIITDVLNKQSLEKAKEGILKKIGKIDVLINGAGGNKKEATTSESLSFFDLPKDAFQFVFDLNFIGTFLPCQVFGKAFAKQKKGIIINISSMASLRVLTKVAGYSAAKSAVNNFTKWLAVHMAKEYSPQIRVNAIAPGFFLTEQNKFLLMDEKTGSQAPRGKMIIEHTPMSRYGKPEDLIGSVIWLISPASEFITGIIIPIDGGFSAYGGV